MELKRINVDDLPKAGPYSHAVMAGNVLFVSGMVGEGATVQEQLTSAMARAEKILKRAGMGLEDVVKVTLYISSQELFQQLNEAYKAVFKGNEPARTTVIAQPPVKGALVEIDIIAFKQR